MKPQRVRALRWAACAATLSSCWLLACTGEVTAPSGKDPVIIVGGNGQQYTQAGNGMLVPVGPSGSGGTGAATPSGGGSGATPPPGGAGAPGGLGGPKPISVGGEPIYTRFMRLSHPQWERAVQDIFRLSAAPGLSQNFEQPVAFSTDFSNNELVNSVSNQLWVDYRDAAEKIAAQVTASAATLAQVNAGTEAAAFITTLGRRAYRRPLTEAEVASYQALFTAGSTGAAAGMEFSKGAGVVIRAMLQSPHFIYRTELGADKAPLNGYEVASKLSFWLLGTTPSDALLESAGKGELDSAEGAVAAATKMLDDPAALQVMRAFYSELFTFPSYGQISKVGVPAYDRVSDTINGEFLEASHLFFDRLFREGLGIREMLTTSTGFVGPGMAELYGLPRVASGFEQRDLGATRVGYFSQLPYLTLYGVNATPDAIHRGVTINRKVLCAEPGIPGDVPPLPPEMAGTTNRERVTELTKGCGGVCHNSYINPIGFAFESFDGIGQVRTKDQGKDVDTSGTYPFAEGEKSFAGVPELMKIMAEGSQAHACFGRMLSGFALQRDIVQTDLPMIETLKTTSMAANGSIKQVMLELVKNAAFRTRVGGPQ